ncbi:UNVERIFIED_CONTAM: hypothetical protein FKN15_076157 [Acipenser sinensis]
MEQEESVAPFESALPAEVRARGLDWQSRRSIPPIPQWKCRLPEAFEVKEPTDYFRHLLKPATIEFMVEQTNLYAIQSDPNRPLNVTNEEMEQFIGICFYMSVYGLPRSRMFWCTSTRVDCVANTMGRHRWETIKHFLHFANNGHDRLFKVRPLLTSLLKSFKATPMDEMLCVDEQSVPFKGKSAMKQYNPKNPKRWGYKVFVLSDSNGILYNFDIYAGSISPVDGMPDIGASGNVVLQLASIIPDNLSYKIFFDNWFCSVDLPVALQKKIHSLGTVRQNRLPERLQRLWHPKERAAQFTGV